MEPSVSVGRELQRRGHEVRLAVPPDLVDFAETAGLATVPYGPELRDFLREDFLRNFWAHVFGNPVAALRELWRPIATFWPQTSATLKSLADGADLLSTGINFEQAAANVAESYDIPLVTLHHFPIRPNGQLVPAVPAPVVRMGGALSERLMWLATKNVENAQRRELGLPPTRQPSQRRIMSRGSLEIQAYDEASVPGLAAEWAKWHDRRPFVGALAMQLSSELDNEVTAWIDAGSPPICFATGSISIESPLRTIEMISSACLRLGERALVCAGGTDFTGVVVPEHVKVVGSVNYATVFPSCRAIVHHGGSGTTAASLRAGIPTLILWSTADQPYWGNQLHRLKAGASRRFSHTTRDTLIDDLRRILTLEYRTGARAVAGRMTAPHDSIAKAADLFEATVRGEVSPEA